MRLYDSQGNEQWIGVDSHFPVGGKNDLACAGMGGKALWAALYEKAAAKLASFDNAAVPLPAKIDGYEALEGGFETFAAKMLLGPRCNALQHTYYDGFYRPTAWKPRFGNDTFSWEIGASRPTEIVERMLTGHVNEGKALASVSFRSAATVPEGVSLNHAYSIACITASRKMILRDPRGTGTFEVPVSALRTPGTSLIIFPVSSV